jgi:hypothetical protein
MEMAVRGLTALGQGNPAAAMDWLEQADREGCKRRTLSSWYWGMVIEWAMTDACLAAGELEAAGAHAGNLHELAYRTRERTWRAMACETGARIALADGDLATAQARLREGWKETDLGPLPLVAWRLHAVEAAALDAVGDPDAAARHRQACADALAGIAQTLPEGHSARDTFASARPIFAS